MSFKKISFGRIAFFSSHGGSAMRGVVAACGKELHAVPALVISNNPDCPALLFAKEKGIDNAVLNVKICGSQEQVDKSIVQLLQEKQIDLIVLSGYMKKIGSEIVRLYPGRIFNIHPALLPKYGGQGMYGMNVHRAVIQAAEQETGITIHVVNEKYDEGPIVAQFKVPVLKGDTAETLAERVKAEEPAFLVRTLRELQAA